MQFRDSPEEGDVLCEQCGYILNGLAADADGHCPECGAPLAASLDPLARKPAPVEVTWTPASFWKTTLLVLVRKRTFFRSTLTRVDSDNVRRFGRLHRMLAGAMFGIAAAVHLAYMAETRLWLTRWSIFSVAMIVIAGFVLVALSILILNAVTRLAVWMTSKESKWWGMRLPHAVLVRAMNFHAANYLPVGILAIAVTGGYRVLYALDWITPIAGVPYLIMLSVLVVVAAFWLFESFVIAMRRIRFANY